MADPHYYAGAQEATAPQIPQQFAQLQQPQQQGYQEQQRYDPQPLPQEQLNYQPNGNQPNGYQPNGYQQEYPQNQGEIWQDDRPVALLEQQLLPQQPLPQQPLLQQPLPQQPQEAQFVSNQQPQQNIQYGPPPQVQDNRQQEYIPNQPEQDPQYVAYQLPPQAQPQQQYHQPNPLEQYQRDSYDQYVPQRQIPLNTRHQVPEPNHQEYWDQPQREFSPIQDARPAYQPAAPRYEPPQREFDDHFDPLPPPREHMRYEPYPEPESDIRYEGHPSRYDHEVGESRYPRHKGYRSLSPEPLMDRSYMRAAERFPQKEYRSSRHDSGMDSRRDPVTRNESIPKKEPYRAERYRPAKGREEYRTRPLRYAYASPERNRSRDEVPNAVPKYEAYKPVESPPRHKYGSPERNRFRFDEMTRALPRVNLNNQPKYPEKAGLRRNVSSTERYTAPDYGYKRSSKRADYPKEPRRRELSPPPPPPKPRHSQRQTLPEPPSPRENFQRSRRSRDRFY